MPKNYLSLLIIIWLLSGLSCAHIDHQACAEVDWYEIGRSDGTIGKDEGQFRKYTEYCSTEEANSVRPLYFHGREAGLSDFCDPVNAFELGTLGKKHGHVCPLEYQDTFLMHYQRGLQFHKVESENLNIVVEMRKLNQTLSRSSLSREIREDAAQRLQSLEGELKVNNKKLSLIEDGNSQVIR